MGILGAEAHPLSPLSRSDIPASAAPRYVNVAVDAKTSLPGDEFTYAIPDTLDLRPGHLVQAPFGRRSVRGVVTSLTDVLRVDYVKPVAHLLHPDPLIDGPRMALARWIADYYMAPLFDALAPMLPPGWRGRARLTIWPVADAEEPADLSPASRRLLAHLRANPQPHQLARLVQAFGPWAQNAARVLVKAGVAEQRVVAPAVRVPRSVQVVLPALAPADLSAYADARSARAPRQAQLARRLARGGETPLTAADARAEYGASAVASLVRGGVVKLGLVPRPEPAIAARLPEPPLLPTPEQSAALAAIGAALRDAAHEPRWFLLRGVTGSGKTEVYLQSLARCLDLGKRAIVLVPELALTPQMVERFEARFPGQVGVLHSSMGAPEQWSQWWAVQRGERAVVIGARSALFAPQPDLGLIIVDEEHEWTYKQSDASPRYHAREAAMELASAAGAVVVLGSATPDVVTADAAERGQRRLALPQRIDRSGAPASMASVEVVDMRAELRDGNRGVFSRALADALAGASQAGKQSVLFLNRRGAGSVVECRSCGHVMRCYRCGTAFTHHTTDAADGRGVLVCHHCNRRRARPARCPSCRSDRIRDLGLGTQRLVEEVRRLLPSARVLRWDRDAAPTAAAHAQLLARFASGEADVLVGTQMVAKGLDFPAVTVAGVVLADVGLHAPDFRAPERTFQLLTQVVGRAGRGDTPGRAVIQTYVPEHYAIVAAARQDYDAFYRDEIRYRRAQGNPPFGRLALLLFGHADPQSARAEAQRLAADLRGLARKWDMRDVDVVGPAPAYPPRVRGAWRWQVVLRASDPRLLLAKTSVPPHWTVDIDPVNV